MQMRSKLKIFILSHFLLLARVAENSNVYKDLISLKLTSIIKKNKNQKKEDV